LLFFVAVMSVTREAVMPRLKSEKSAELEAFWRSHHEGWVSSSLNQREYCETHGLPLKRFGNWRAKFKDEAAAAQKGLLYRRGGGLSHMSTLGRVEKMSKSKRNTVDPAQIIETYGADTARWFVLSDSPPDRELEWTDAGIEGAWRFARRLWRLIDDAADALPPAGSPAPSIVDGTASTLRKQVHKAVAAITKDIEAFHFNKAVARIYELTNAVAGTTAAGPDGAWARREACEMLARLCAPMMPHLAEEL
jgi:leucyl-tRNA synthetase